MTNQQVLIQFPDGKQVPFAKGVTLTEIDLENTPASIEAVNFKLYESLIPTLLKHNVTVCLENLFSSKGCLIEGCCSNPHTQRP